MTNRADVPISSVRESLVHGARVLDQARRTDELEESKYDRSFWVATSEISDRLWSRDSRPSRPGRGYPRRPFASTGPTALTQTTRGGASPAEACVTPRQSTARTTIASMTSLIRMTYPRPALARSTPSKTWGCCGRPRFQPISPRYRPACSRSSTARSYCGRSVTAPRRGSPCRGDVAARRSPPSRPRPTHRTSPRTEGRRVPVRRRILVARV